MNKNTVLVTGGAGYIGSWATQRFLWKGYKVVVLDQFRFGSQSLRGLLGHPNLTVLEGDIRRPGDVAKAMAGVDFVAHLAAIVGEAACKAEPDEARSINLDGSLNVLKAAMSAGVRRMVFFSTCSSYGVQDTGVMAHEQTQLNPVSLYAETKIDGEKLLLGELGRHDLSLSIFRPSTVHGPSARMRFDLMVNHFVKDAFLSRKLTILGPDMWRPLMWVGDAGKAIDLAFQADASAVRGEIFNLGGVQGNYRKREIGEIIQRDYLPDLDLVIGQSDPDLRSYRVDFNKIEKKLGFRLSTTLSQDIGALVGLLKFKSVEDFESPLYRNA